METETHTSQEAQLPQTGHAITASFDAETITVYQAYHPVTAAFAVEHQRLGGPRFSFNRMSWIKSSFLWMMYRSGWATKEGQERILAFRLRRERFDAYLAAAVAAQFHESEYPDKPTWQAALKTSEVRVQWDPDRDPWHAPLARRAVQLGLRGDTLRRFAEDDCVGIEDVTSFVHANDPTGQRETRVEVLVPRQRVYVPGSRDDAS